VPDGSAFEVAVPEGPERFVHRAGTDDTVGNATYLDDPLLNGKPGAEASVTQNWNPGGGNGVYNDHPVGVLWDEDVGKWLVYNEDGTRMPEGAPSTSLSRGTRHHEVAPPRSDAERTSENPLKAKFAELPFHALG
jgi:hypothetical protein